MNIAIVENIQKKLKQKKLSVVELERNAGLKRSAVANILDGKSKNPSIDTVSRLARYFNCSIDELLYKMPDMKKTSTNLDLYSKVVQEVCACIQKNGYEMQVKDFFACCQEICTYILENDKETIDSAFISWLTKKYAKK